MQQAKFTYSPLGKAFEKHTENWVGAIKFLDLSNKKDELKQIESIFPQNLMNDLVCVKFKEIVTFQDIIKTDNLSYKSKSRKVYSLSEYSLTMFLLFRNVHKGHLSLKDADYEQSNFAANVFNKKLYKIPSRESTREPATELTKHKKSKSKLQQEFINEIITDKKDMNDEIFWNYFKYQNRSQNILLELRKLKVSY